MKELFPPLLRRVIAATEHFEVDVISAFTLDLDEALVLTQAGFRKKITPPATVHFHRHSNDTSLINDMIAQDLIVDLGVETLNRT